jgi:HAD superfamily hydrolase (TIGR01509 family)
MQDKCGGVQTPEYFTQELIQTQALKMRGNTPTMPGALALVRQLQEHGIKTGLVSASPRNIVDAVLDNLGHYLFPFSISSDDVENTKPHPDCYLKAASMTDSDITKCLIFEDSLTGMNAATLSGAYLIAVPHLVTIEESTKVRVITSLEQLNLGKLQQLFEDFSTAI